MSLAILQNAALIIFSFSPCVKSLPKDINKNTLVEELRNAAPHLGIEANNIIDYNFPVREFPSVRQEILEELIQLKNKYNPDLVLLPSSIDIHQDHKVIYEEGLRAFKHCNLLGYELPWNNTAFTSNFHISLKKEHLEAKWNAISEYKSQKNRPYYSLDFFMGLAKVRGVQANVEYAEAFELIRWHI